MPKSYDVKFREKILEAYLEKEGSIPAIAKRFKVSESTVKRIARRHRETGSLELYIYNAGRHELIDDAGKATLKKLLKITPDLTLRELQEKYVAIHQVKPVLTVFHNVLKKMKLTYKKKSKFAEQQLREDIKKKREIFSAWIEHVDPEDLIVLDESGAQLGMSRERGRISSHERLFCPAPYERGNKYSMMSAISTQKIVASLYCEDSVDGVIFEHFIEQCLAPHLKPQHKIIMDNVPFHKMKAIEKIIQATGAEIIYLPPYSPDFSPIELMWSKIKSVLKKHAARTPEEFQTSMCEAFHAVTMSDLQGWFKHCGYKI